VNHLALLERHQLHLIIEFLQRCQNLPASNDQPWAGNDGGFAYTPANKGESFAGEYADEAGNRRLRSYGSMTYAGLKSFIYAGLSKDDPRVKAAFGWITQNFTVTENPGMRTGNPEQAKQGLFYYYLTLARAMYAYDQPLIPTPAGPVDWREALVRELESVQLPDGSFVGDARWMEQSPVLVTAYVVLALQDVRADLARSPFVAATPGR
jgi:squalene-hopene/tetraprenyl-beta-curcumene cyclase